MNNLEWFILDARVMLTIKGDDYNVFLDSARSLCNKNEANSNTFI